MKIISKILLTILIYTLVRPAKCNKDSNKTYVVTPMGIVQGYFDRSWKNRTYESFMGIPYAHPPIGTLRFEPAVPLVKWKKTIVATSPPPSCSQYDVENNTVLGKEDCLYLNVYVPIYRKENKRLPVLFWIHGGAFETGTSSKYSAKYLMDRDIILVTVNYRLGAFGFLSTNDHVIPGNMGLKDQNLALRWVVENIKYFGGDPKRVSLAGQSSGAACVHFHYLSPMSTGLFHNGMSFSGCALDTGALKPDNSNVTRNLATVLQCPLDSTKTMSECLKQKTMKEIIRSTHKIEKKLRTTNPIFLPVLEKIQSDYFINTEPSDIIKSGNVSDVPWITGIVKDEGLYKTVDFFTNESKAENLDKNWEIVGADLLAFIYNVPKNKWANFLKAARKHYLGSEPISTDKDTMLKVTHIVGDYELSINAQRAAQLHVAVNKSPVYFYYYAYSAATSTITVGPNKNIILGVSHGDDVHFIFGGNGMNPTTTETDRAMLEVILDYWYSVIDTGKPNLGVPWLDVGSSKDFQFMHIIDPEQSTMMTNNNLSEIKFWCSIGL